MDYERKYKEVLEWMQSLYSGLHGKTKEEAEHYFPELKESKDEKIKREIVAYINELADLKNEKIPTKWLDWLEKQKDHIKFPNSAYTSNKDVIEFANKYSHTVWGKLMDNFKIIENYSIGCNDVSDIVLNAIINTYNWLEKQGEKKPTLPKWKYKKDHIPLLKDSLILNKYGCVGKSPSGAIVSDVWVLDYDELAKLPKEELEKQGEQETLCDKCRKEHPSHSCQDITELGRCAVEHEQETDNSYCQENCKEFQETGKCFADGDCKAKKEYIEQNFQENNFPQIEQKPAWSKEDDYNVQCLIAKVTYDIQKGNVGRNYKLIDWLKSLKQRIGG